MHNVIQQCETANSWRMTLVRLDYWNFPGQIVLTLYHLHHTLLALLTRY